ncbi:hypothetical protein BS47DRAFT_1341415, partial [Hydnum rufescens UP504]
RLETMNNLGHHLVFEPQGSKPLSSKVSSIASETRTLRKRKERIAHMDLDLFEDAYQATDPDFSIEWPRSKKRKARKGATVSDKPKLRKKGKLASLLLIMPVEVLCEFSFPIGFNSCRLRAKIFALFLLHPSAATIWRAARLQIVDLPDIHDDLTEQQFANLLFGSVCNVRLREAMRKRTGSESKLDTPSLCGLDPNYSPFVFSLYDAHLLGRFQSRRYRGHVMDTRKAKAMDPTAEGKVYQDYIETGMKLFEHAKACRRWQEAKDAERAKELDKFRQERLVKRIGWSDSIVENIRWHGFPTMNRSRHLTES